MLHPRGDVHAFPKCPTLVHGREARLSLSLSLYSQTDRNVCCGACDLYCQALPGQIIPNVTVLETRQSEAETKYMVTFHQEYTHLSGDQAEIECNVGGCDIDGCQPRYAGMKSAYRVVLDTVSGGEDVRYVLIWMPMAITAVTPFVLVVVRCTHYFGSLGQLSSEYACECMPYEVKKRMLTCLRGAVNGIPSMPNRILLTRHQMPFCTVQSYLHCRSWKF